MRSVPSPSALSPALTLGDNLNRLTLIAALNPIGIPVAGFGYGYDPSGNRTQKNTLEHSEMYRYDPLDRLSRADRQNPDESDAGTWVWRYDAVGNRTNAQANSETTTGNYNEKNQLYSMTGGGSTLWRGTLDEPGLVDFTSATVNGQAARMLPGNVFEANLDLPAGPNTVTIRARDGSGNEATKNYSVNVTGGAASYTYDANGNLKTKTEGVDVWVYEWNAMNQLIEVKKGTTVQNATMVATFADDPIGRRILKATPTKTVAYTYDGADILRENVTTSGSTLTSYYVHGPGIDEPLSKETGASVTYYHADALGSIVKETGAAGAVTNTLRNDVWGNIEAGARDGFTFTGREWDPETRLYYYRARYYSPRMGRFISEDPIGFGGGVNVYSYALNNPGLFRDPLGLQVNLNLFDKLGGDKEPDKNGKEIDPYDTAQNSVAPGDVYTVAGHGWRDKNGDVVIGSRTQYGTDESLTAWDLAHKIWDDPAWTGQPIETFACSTWGYAGEVAQYLAFLEWQPATASGYLSVFFDETITFDSGEKWTVSPPIPFDVVRVWIEGPRR